MNDAVNATRRQSGVRWSISGATLVAVQVLSAGAVSAQLTAESIAALRAEGAAKGWTFTVGKNAVTHLSLDRLCGLVEPKDWREEGLFTPRKPRLGLASSFDWRTLSGCPPIRDQASCGSCWAFSTVGALECAIKIMDGVTVDLSEQWLISCNRDGWDCTGGWFAHDYHQFKTDSCGGTGAVFESDSPYVASDATCDCPYDHEYLIDGWAYVGSGGSVPNTADIKQAIMDYGPVSVAVHTNSAMQAYTGGVFNDCTSGAVDHAVVLVGWDDNQGTSGVWFMRNSWGPGWGEAGYMRIEYGCSDIGYAACYVDYPGRDDLTVDPKSEFVSSGEVGGPFIPACKSYTLANEGTSPLDWTATWNEPWLEATPSGGTLAGGASATVDICIVAAAETLSTGAYSDILMFTNTTSGASRTRSVTLRVSQTDYSTELFSAGDNDLSNKSLTFTPDGSSSFYRACAESITYLPTDPTGGTTLALGDDDHATVTLSGATVLLYGQSASTFYVGSNGYITFGTGDNNMNESLDDHFGTRRISALFDDLNAYAGGTVSWKQLANRAVVTWQGVPEYGTSNSNTFQIEMHFDGVIRISWLGIDAVDGLAGLSEGGGIPGGFLESDLSGYVACPPLNSLFDFDHDGDVDGEDVDFFESCATGPEIPQNDPACADAKLDGDQDVDQSDFGMLQRCLSGPGVQPDPNCAD